MEKVFSMDSVTRLKAWSSRSTGQKPSCRKPLSVASSFRSQEFARLTKFLVLFDRPTPEQRQVRSRANEEGDSSSMTSSDQ